LGDKKQEMMDEKLVSIVLPVYNGEKYLALAIESILAQTYKNWELILVNDCSTDGTSEIMESYRLKDSRIQILHNDENLKLPRSLNAGFSKASGVYYTWTSDDNLLKPEMLATLAEAMEKDPSLGLVYSNYTGIDESGKETGLYEMQEPEAIFSGNPVGASFLYRADTAKKIGGYDGDLFLAEDYDYWMRIFAEAPIKKIPENLYYYRRHEGSLTETRKTGIARQTFRAVQKNYEKLLKRAKSPENSFELKEKLLSLADETQFLELLAEYKQDKDFIRWRKRKQLRQKLGRMKARLLGVQK
jgi:glycosyltransferase involved in cell wall biosynthesis